jgi:sialidase-1
MLGTTHVALTFVFAAFIAAQPPGVVVFLNSSEGYHTFRIPTLAAFADTSTLLAFAEGRARLNFTTGDTIDCYGEGASAFDWKCTNKDVVLKRSLTGGLTWLPVQVLAQASATYFFSNPQPLITSAGTAFVQYSRCDSTHIPPDGNSFTNCTAVLQRSEDMGATWSAPTLFPPTMHNAGGFGGLQLASGRLIFSLAGETGCLYSDDGGKTWAFGQSPQHVAENQIAEVAANQLLMTSRGKNNSRVLLRSSDGGLSWGPPQLQAVTDPNCQASMISVRTRSNSSSSFLLFANPHTSGLLPYAEGRQNVTVQISYDAGLSWTPLLLIDQGPSAYTALAQLTPSGDACGILYEESGDLPVDFRSIRFVQFPCAGQR